MQPLQVNVSKTKYEFHMASGSYQNRIIIKGTIDKKKWLRVLAQNNQMQGQPLQIC